MAFKVLVTDILTEEMISAGEALLRRLDEAKVPVVAALWFFLVEANRWRLLIATPAVEIIGPKRVYEEIERVMAKIPPNQPQIQIDAISAVDPNHNFILPLRRAMKIRGIAGKRILRTVYNGLHVQDAYIYRVT